MFGVDRTWRCMFSFPVFTDLSVKLWERSVTTVHSSSWGQGALWGWGHGLTFGSVASSWQLPVQCASVLRGGAWKKDEDGLSQEGTAETQLTDRSDFTGSCDSRMPNPLLALMERPGSARFLVIEGMLTEPLNPARLSWTRTFWFKQDRECSEGGEEWGGCECVKQTCEDMNGLKTQQIRWGCLI